MLVQQYISVLLAGTNPRKADPGYYRLVGDVIAQLMQETLERGTGLEEKVERFLERGEPAPRDAQSIKGCGFFSALSDLIFKTYGSSVERILFGQDYVAEFSEGPLGVSLINPPPPLIAQGSLREGYERIEEEKAEKSKLNYRKHAPAIALIESGLGTSTRIMTMLGFTKMGLGCEGENIDLAASSYECAKTPLERVGLLLAFLGIEDFPFYTRATSIQYNNELISPEEEYGLNAQILSALKQTVTEGEEALRVEHPKRLCPAGHKRMVNEQENAIYAMAHELRNIFDNQVTPWFHGLSMREFGTRLSEREQLYLKGHRFRLDFNAPVQMSIPYVPV